MVTEVVFLELSGTTEMQLVGAEIDSFEDGDGEYFLQVRSERFLFLFFFQKSRSSRSPYTLEIIRQ